MRRDTMGTTGDLMNPQFAEGTPVYDMSGDKVGVVSEHGVQDGSLVIHHGLTREDVYLPLSIVQSNDVNGIYLAVSKDNALNGNWNTTATSSTATMAPPDATLTSSGTATPANAASGEVITEVPVREEEIVAGKREGQVGSVHVHRDVEEQQQSANVPLRQERVSVERVPGHGAVTNAGSDAFTEQDIDVPVMGEEAVIGKQVVEKEDVLLRKEPYTQEQQVGGTVRKERVTVEGGNGVIVDDESQRR